MKGVVQIFTFHIWTRFIKTKADASSCLSDFVVWWRDLWASALSLIGARISTSEEPRCQKRRAVLSFDTQDDAVTVRLL